MSKCLFGLLVPYRVSFSARTASNFDCLKQDTKLNQNINQINLKTMNRLITTYLAAVCMMLSAISFAQITATQAGIAVQGIARDANNTARVNASITLNVRIHAAGNDIVPQQSTQVQTDAFGVFSFVLDVTQNNYPAIANQGAELEIREGTTLISNEPLRFVPYAIAAANGVPTGAIMPYAGNSAPAGWALCDGAAIPTGAAGDALRTLVGGNNTPNLIDRFIVGAGTTYNVNATGGANTVTLTTNQIPSHNHGGSTSTDGNHNHSRNVGGRTYDRLLTLGDVGDTPNGADNRTGADEPRVIEAFPMAGAGAHSHTIGNEGGNPDGSTAPHENRPPYYALTYIIKL